MNYKSKEQIRKAITDKHINEFVMDEQDTDLMLWVEMDNVEYTIVANVEDYQDCIIANKLNHVTEPYAIRDNEGSINWAGHHDAIVDVYDVQDDYETIVDAIKSGLEFRIHHIEDNTQANKNKTLLKEMKETSEMMLHAVKAIGKGAINV